MDEDAEDDTETVAIGKRKLRIRKDTNNRKLVDMDMVNALEAVLTNPSSTRQTLAAATSLASKAFLACVARAGAAIEKPEYVVNSEKGSCFRGRETKDSRMHQVPGLHSPAFSIRGHRSVVLHSSRALSYGVARPCGEEARKGRKRNPMAV